jgi:hypothetical protein
MNDDVRTLSFGDTSSRFIGLQFNRKKISVTNDANSINTDAESTKNETTNSCAVLPLNPAPAIGSTLLAPVTADATKPVTSKYDEKMSAAPK